MLEIAHTIEATSRTEDELVAAVRDRDAQAFESLYVSYFSYVSKTAYSFLRRDAEDVVQEVFMRLMTRPPDLPLNQGTLRPWFYRITKNVCIDRCRSAKCSALEMSVPIDEWFDSELVETNDAFFVVSDREFAVAASAAIARLQECFRQIADMFFLQGMKIHEIAEALGCPEGTVKTRIMRSRAKLASSLAAFAEK